GCSRSPAARRSPVTPCAAGASIVRKGTGWTARSTRSRCAIATRSHRPTVRQLRRATGPPITRAEEGRQSQLEPLGNQDRNLYVMKTLQVCTPRKSVLDGTADFVVNLADLPRLSEAEARE